MENESEIFGSGFVGTLAVQIGSAQAINMESDGRESILSLVGQADCVSRRNVVTVINMEKPPYEIISFDRVNGFIHIRRK